MTTADAVDRAVIRHEKACQVFENAQEKEHATYEELKNAIEYETKERLDIYRPHGCL
ncbi:hypothetical protein LCGC14_2034520 [marine sediment metagenome]|uniref:Uncharacterized protein n=1 Tax=marine sediment metagenome TaxID=412755 RepID=A0A0F9FG91_9ZZZZ